MKQFVAFVGLCVGKFVGSTITGASIYLGVYVAYKVIGHPLIVSFGAPQ